MLNSIKHGKNISKLALRLVFSALMLLCIFLHKEYLFSNIVCIYYLHEESRSAFIILTGTPTGKRLLGRPRRRWENNIRMDVK